MLIHIADSIKWSEKQLSGLGPANQEMSNILHSSMHCQLSLNVCCGCAHC